ncbi:MAG: RtcB family protein [Chloroflexi bacterium]|nr:RtcB family protein [Chloroflexota bacterium]
MARWDGPLNRIDDYRWEIPKNYKPGMRVPGLIYASEEMLESIREEQAAEQVVNVAFLPGIVGHSLAMPDIHWGYGFPIGGVAATRVEDGVVSPGGVGYDINCGVRLLRTNLSESEVRPKMEKLLLELFHDIPSGLGSTGKVKVGKKELDEILTGGARWAVKRGFGTQEDLEVSEEGGCLKGADPDKVSSKAKERGLPQSGTLGSGNHFLEVQVVGEIYEPATARGMGIEEAGQVLFLVHTGSRGLGHQVCGDYVSILREAMQRYDIDVPDRELACAPVKSAEGRDYLAAMACAANYAWANRQCITHWARECFMKVFSKSPRQIGLEMVYDVAHNIAKIESYEVEGKKLSLCVHRKGATRAFPPGHLGIPARYKEIGQPVLIPGDMGRYSFVAVGAPGAIKDSFGSVCHGAGRTMSRHAARKGVRDADVAREMAARGILVMAASRGGLAEEASEAYKDVAGVVEICHRAGLCRKVAKTYPIGVVKG